MNIYSNYIGAMLFIHCYRCVFYISLRKKIVFVSGRIHTSCMFFFSFSNVYVLLQSFTFFNQRYCVIENNRELMCFFVVHCFFLFSFCFILLFFLSLTPIPVQVVFSSFYSQSEWFIKCATSHDILARWNPQAHQCHSIA